MILVPDADTMCSVPWYESRPPQVICDAVHRDGTPVRLAPRYVLKNVLELYHAEGWQPLVAPELEFFLAKKNIDPDYPLLPPAGQIRPPANRAPGLSIDAVNEFDPLFEDIYEFCEAQEDRHRHADPRRGRRRRSRSTSITAIRLQIADQSFLFKRTVRNVALRHDIYATFMAKPYEHEPGSAMHIHQSVDKHKSQKEHLLHALGQGHAPVPRLYRRAAAISAGRHAVHRALREFLSPHRARSVGAREHALGPREPHGGLAHSGIAARRTGASKTACPAPTPILISRSRCRSPAAISA